MTADELQTIFDTADAILNQKSDGCGQHTGCMVCNGKSGIVLDYTRGDLICSNCGTVQPSLVADNGNFNFVRVGSNYKRIHHFHERISQLLLCESNICDAHWQAISSKITESNFTELNKTNIRKVLRSLNMQIYIEKWLQIMFRYANVRPPRPPSSVLLKLDQMFLALQTPFAIHKSKSRRNFLNYNFVFNRLFHMLGIPEFGMFFPLIKSKNKLRLLEETWQQMCKNLQWECPKLQEPRQFSIILPLGQAASFQSQAQG